MCLDTVSIASPMEPNLLYIKQHFSVNNGFHLVIIAALDAAISGVPRGNVEEY